MKPVFVLLDPTNPYLQLPKATCNQFEKLLGLHRDERSDLYWVDPSTRSRLRIIQPNFTFELGGAIDGQAVRIALPYASFDLEERTLLDRDSSAYFSPRIASADETILGRTFFQEA